MTQTLHVRGATENVQLIWKESIFDIVLDNNSTESNKR